jgi:carbonic anhydrase
MNTVTCMDARLNVLAHLGLKEGDAHIIRNGGGTVYVSYSLSPCSSSNIQNSKGALNSLIISQRLLGTREIAVFHHTGCGMLNFTTPQLRDIVRLSDATSEQIESIDFYEFSDVEESVKNDVEWLKKERLILTETVITGWVYEVETGKVRF